MESYSFDKNGGGSSFYKITTPYSEVSSQLSEDRSERKEDLEIRKAKKSAPATALIEVIQRGKKDGNSINSDIKSNNNIESINNDIKSRNRSGGGKRRNISGKSTNISGDKSSINSSGSSNGSVNNSGDSTSGDDSGGRTRSNSASITTITTSGDNSGALNSLEQKSVIFCHFSSFFSHKYALNLRQISYLCQISYLWTIFFHELCSKNREIRLESAQFDVKILKFLRRQNHIDQFDREHRRKFKIRLWRHLIVVEVLKITREI